MSKKVEKEKNVANNEELKNAGAIIDNVENVSVQEILKELKEVRAELSQTKDELKEVKENSSTKMTDEEVKEMLEKNKDIFKMSKADLEAMNKKTYQSTKEALANEKRITTIIPKSELNPNDIVIPVMINGYVMQVNRGVEVELPMSVYKAIKDGGYI